jgi:hypothetical protein
MDSGEVGMIDATWMNEGGRSSIPLTTIVVANPAKN